jgi:hypothetical protein
VREQAGTEMGANSEGKMIPSLRDVRSKKSKQPGSSERQHRGDLLPHGLDCEGGKSESDPFCLAFHTASCTWVERI